MIKPKPNTETHCSADRGGTSGIMVGPRTRRKFDHGIFVSAGTAVCSFPATTVGTNVAWYTCDWYAKRG